MTEHVFCVEKINSRVTRIVLPGNVFAYYLEGEDKGLLIDTGYGVDDLKSFVDGISSKEYDVALTHGHLDHAGGAGQWETVYLNEKDKEVAKIHTGKTIRAEFLKRSGTNVSEDELRDALPTKRYLDLPDGKEFDLGGIHARFISLPGHTQGSMVVYIPEYRILLFGDAVNSAAYLQLPESSGLHSYRNSLIEFENEYGGLYESLLFSHPHNFGGAELVSEMIELCSEFEENPEKGIFDLQMFGEGVRLAKPIRMPFTDAEHTFRREDGKTANMVYDPGKVKE